MSDKDIEQEIQAKGLTAPRITRDEMIANIAHTEIVKHVSVTGQVLRWAIITTKNGFAVTGKPSCAVSSENDNEAIGKQIALENAEIELWPLMGYALKQNICNGKSRAQQVEYVNRAVVEGHTSYYGLKDANWLSDDCLKIEYELAQAYYEPAPGEKAPLRDLGE